MIFQVRIILEEIISKLHSYTILKRTLHKTAFQFEDHKIIRKIILTPLFCQLPHSLFFILYCWFLYYISPS